MTTFLSQTRLVFFREFRALLATPLYYVLTGIFFLLTSMIYLVMLLEFVRGDAGSTVNVTESVVRPMFHGVHFFLMVQIPLLTMRVFAEDRSSGMLDLLQTTPARDWALVMGKFLGTLAGILLYIALTALFPLLTAAMGTVEWPVIIGSLAALVLGSAAYIAVGIFFSAVTEAQVVAAVLSYVALFVIFFASYFADGFQSVAMKQAVDHFAVMEHISSILSGNIAAMNVVYFIALGSIFLFLTARLLESRRWSN